MDKKKYYSIDVCMLSWCGDGVTLEPAENKTQISVLIKEATPASAISCPSSLCVSLVNDNRNKTQKILMNDSQHRFWFGYESELLSFYKEQGIILVHTEYILSGQTSAEALTCYLGIQPIGLLLFPDYVETFYDPELLSVSVPDYWQPRR